MKPKQLNFEEYKIIDEKIRRREIVDRICRKYYPEIKNWGNRKEKGK